MNGFVQNMEKNHPSQGFQAINMFNYTEVPIITTLAREYAVFDRWFCDHPGPTDPNRFFSMSGTSYGKAFNDKDQALVGYPQKTIFDQINEVGKTFHSYWFDESYGLGFKRMRTPENLKKFKLYNHFLTDLENGQLADFSFIEPQYHASVTRPSNDEHPDHPVNVGEAFIKEIYEALRASRYWNESLLIITYDEHGGFYDHVPTPLNVPNPDGRESLDPPFNFTRTGIRIPTVMVSPWINKGTVVHGPKGPFKDSQFTASSVIATLKKVWGFKEFLTKRVEWAGTFEEVVMQRKSPRTDCLEKLAEVKEVTAEELEEQKNLPINSLQQGLLEMTAGLMGIDNVMNSVKT